MLPLLPVLACLAAAIASALTAAVSFIAQGGASERPANWGINPNRAFALGTVTAGLSLIAAFAAGWLA